MVESAADAATAGPEAETAVVLITAEGVGMRFRGTTEDALCDFSVVVRAGRVVGLVGPDGAGKTTFLRLAASLLRATAGSLTVLGHDPARRAGARAVRGRIGYMPQRFGLYEDLTVQENLDLYADLRALATAERAGRFAEVLELTGLGPFTARRVGALSGGMQQKLGLACSLLERPELLLLDEPTVGVDPVSRRELWELVYRVVEHDRVGVVLATSYLDEADRCHEVVVLDHGRQIAAGPPAELREDVRGRVFVVAPGPHSGPRRTQSALAGEPFVADATIRSGRVRCVVDAGADERLRAAARAAGAADVTAAEPVFEDDFMAMWSERAERGAWRAASRSARRARESDDDDASVIRVRDLTKRFGAFTAVEGISFDVRRGEVFGLLGPNGAGKTTTFRMLCGLTRASGGELAVAGLDLRRSPDEARARLGYMAQRFALYQQLTVDQNLAFYGRAYGLSGRRLRERLDWAFDEFGLRERRKADAGALPGGYRQRLAMAAAMLHEPDILFLDEPTSGADPLARREFWLRIGGFARGGVTVIVTTHFMEEAENCDRMLIMQDGRELAQGRPARIRALAASDDNPEPTVEDAFVALAEGRVGPPGEDSA